jgi:hypothetical protein
MRPRSATNDRPWVSKLSYHIIYIQLQRTSQKRVSVCISRRYLLESKTYLILVDSGIQKEDRSLALDRTCQKVRFWVLVLSRAGSQVIHYIRKIP